MKIHLLVVLAAFWLDDAHAVPGTVCPAPQSPSNMVITMDAEFAKTGQMNREQWHVFTGLHGDSRHELQAFAEDDVSVKQGAGLALRTEKRPLFDHPYRSGQVTSEGLFSQTFGHFEMLAKFPQANGLWPAFWLMPISNHWPPEIDIVEYIYAPWGHLPKRSGHRASNPQTTLHWRDEAGVPEQAAQGVNSDIDYFKTYEDWATTPAPSGWDALYIGYHDYAVDWRPGSLSWFIDGKPVFCVNDTAKVGKIVPNEPMYMIVNDAISAGTPQHPGWPGYLSPDVGFPQEMDVAFIRVARFKDLAATQEPPVEIREVTASSYRVKPGDRVELSALLRVATQGGFGPVDGQFTIRQFDARQYTGIGADAGDVSVHLVVRAGQANPLHASFVVPKSMLPGAYSVGLRVVCPVNGGSTFVKNRVHAELAQGAVLTVTNGKP